MREAFGALTTRGRGFLAGGVTAVVCGMVLGERDLVRIGLLVALLPLIAVAWVARSRHSVELTRTLENTQMEVGRPVSVRLRLTSTGRRTPTLLLEDHIPYALGARPRFRIDPIPAGGGLDLEYQVRSDVRGSYRVGPLRVLVADPFGMLEIERSLPAVEQLLVTPRVDDLPPIGLGSSWSGSGDSRPRSFVTGNAADVTVREYRTGDDLRRVHWASSAHRGQLMVRREEQPWQSRCTLLVDNRGRAHRGRAAASSLETAVRAAASILVHLTARGYQVRVVTATGESLSGSNPDSVDPRPVLGRLATLTTAGVPVLATDWVDDRMASGLFLAVLGGLEEQDRAFFSRVGHLGGPTFGLVLDVAAWGGPAPPASTSWLQGIGWRVSVLGPRDALSNAWQELGR